MLPPCFSFLYLSCFLPFLSPSLSPYLSPVFVSVLCLLLLSPLLSPPLCLPLATSLFCLPSLSHVSVFSLSYIYPSLSLLSNSLCLSFLSGPLSQLSVAPHLASVSLSSIGFRLRVRYFCPPDSIPTTYLQFLSYSTLG
jgi:hypothetical protein